MSLSSHTEFSPEGYVRLVCALEDVGYAVASFQETDPNSRHLILRHDIDMSLQAAADLALIETQAGWKAHYFVLLRTEMYNVFSRGGKHALSAIIDAGHEVGLHFDCSLYLGDDGPDVVARLDAAAAHECAILESITERPVRFISLHRPAPAMIRNTHRLAGRPHSYMPRFVEDMGYCSDSRGIWRYGHPLDHPALISGRALQLLTHPIWWIARADETVLDKLDRFVATRYELLRHELAHNCIPYRQRVGDSRLPARPESRNSTP